MRRRRSLFVGLALLVLLAGLGVTQQVLEKTAAAQSKAAVQAPRFEVDPMWPKPLPNHWVMGNVIGVGVDSQDHVYIIHRGAGSLEPKEIYAAANPPASECCLPAPPVLEFDTDGTLLRSWGGPGQGYEWPESNHGIFVDHKGIVWMGGNVGADSQVLKFTPDGKFVAQFGRSGQNKGSNDPVNFGRPAKIFVDPRQNEAYIADGYLNKRTVVIDADTGAFKRYWGAYGNKPDDTPLGAYNPDDAPAQQYRGPVHCSDLSVDNLVYVCDRQNNRLQVFTREGKFLREVVIAKKTRGDGAIWDVAFSKDPQQKYIYIADGKNERIYVLLRETLEVLTTFGDGGRQPGQFFAVHSIATDSKGNIFTTETYEGRRLQKFVYKGIAQVPRDQGVVWPKK